MKSDGIATIENFSKFMILDVSVTTQERTIQGS
jgi:hypothetical protein